MEEKILFKEKASAGIGALIVLLFSGLSFLFSYLCLMTYIDAWEMGFPFMILGGFLALIAFLIIVFGKNSQICITDKRVYGKTLLGKRIDLPLDSISSVSLTNPLLSGISFSSNSGKISFYLISNKENAHEIISNLIINRQRKTSETVVKQEISQSNADELKKFKELLDSGIITQEEFDAKKKQLLGL